MQIRLTVVDPLGASAPGRDRAPRSDVLVTAPAGTALAAVASALAQVVSGGDGSGTPVLYAGEQRLDAQRCTLGEPPLTDGAVLSVGAPGEPEPHPEWDDAPAQLQVVAGPDAGGVHLLHGGEIRIGRSADADVPLDDPDVSRLHCAVTVGADGRVSVADLDSTNGTTLDGARVGGRAVRFAPGALLRIGESALRLAPAGGPGGRVETTPDGEGHVRVPGPAEDDAAPSADGPAGHRAISPTRAASPDPAGPSGPTWHTYGRAAWAGVPGTSGQGPGEAARPGQGPGESARAGQRPGDGVRPGQGPGESARAGQSPGVGVRPGQGPGEGVRPGQGPGDGVRPGQGPGDAVVPGQGGAPRIEGEGRTAAQGPRPGSAGSVHASPALLPPEGSLRAPRQRGGAPSASGDMDTHAGRSGALGPRPGAADGAGYGRAGSAFEAGHPGAAPIHGTGHSGPGEAYGTGTGQPGAGAADGMGRPRAGAHDDTGRPRAGTQDDTGRPRAGAPDGSGHGVARTGPGGPATPSATGTGIPAHAGETDARRSPHGPAADAPLPGDERLGRGRKGTPLRGTDVPPGTRRRGGLGAWARRLAGGRAEQPAQPHGTYDEDEPAVTVAAEHPVAGPAVPDTWPDPATLLLTALGPGPRLWERGPGHPEALAVRLGTADRAAPDGSGLLPAVPVTAGLREVGALGLAGPRTRLSGLARAVLAQLAALHSPDTLEIVLITADRSRPLEERTAEWSWLGWLPHVRPGHGQDCRLLLAHDREQAAARTEELLRRLEDQLTEEGAGTHATGAVPAGTRPSGTAGTPGTPGTTDAAGIGTAGTTAHIPGARSSGPRAVRSGDRPGAPASHSPASHARVGDGPGDRAPGAGVPLPGVGAADDARTADGPGVPASRPHGSGGPGDRASGADGPQSGARVPGAPVAPAHGSAGSGGRPSDPRAPQPGNGVPGPRPDGSGSPAPHVPGARPAAAAGPAATGSAGTGSTATGAAGTGSAATGSAATGPAALRGEHPQAHARPVTRRPSWAREDTTAPAAAGGFAGPYTVLVVDGDPGGADLRDAVARLAVEGPRAGIHVICLAETAAASPASPVTETYEAACSAAPTFRECGAVALLSGDVATALRLMRVARGDGAAPGPVGHGTIATVDAVSPAWAERFARALAPLRTDGPAGGRQPRVSAPLPQAARLLDELGLARATPASLMARWADAADDTDALGGRARAVLGAGPRGPVCADLAAQGPHLLVEGPPGSGRTELLRAVVASLAAAERPDRLGIVLVDGRGGPGAGGGPGEGLRVCTDVPHVSTYLTAHDPVRMREFAQSLSAELKRRAELLGRSDFAEWHTGRELSGRMVAQRTAAARGSQPGESAAGAGDLDSPSSSTLRLRPGGARRQAEAAAPPLPRLVVVVDDLDALVSPALGSTGRPAAGSVMRALEAVAREGERLGVHLVAATGPCPRTAETEPARRATLRVTLDAPAQGPDEPAPGRGSLACADGRVTPFQGGRVTGRIPRTATLRPTVVPLEWHRMGDPPARRPVRELGNGPTDLALLASALERAAREVAAARVPSLL
ncbi:FHA domain-containing protein [Streptomyces sp. NPDC057837]|uniref:FHA domain-containing protein n=1 Tax=Streptomyces sp. NPDC057837 TaxID=3346260 RepID=UPI0036B401B5